MNTFRNTIQPVLHLNNTNDPLVDVYNKNQESSEWGVMI